MNIFISQIIFHGVKHILEVIKSPKYYIIDILYMSFQLSNVNKTDLVPQTVLGYNNASQYISIDPSSGIVFYNSTSNITATIALLFIYLF